MFSYPSPMPPHFLASSPYPRDYYYGGVLSKWALRCYNGAHPRAHLIWRAASFDLAAPLSRYPRCSAVRFCIFYFASDSSIWFNCVRFRCSVLISNWTCHMRDRLYDARMTAELRQEMWSGLLTKTVHPKWHLCHHNVHLYISLVQFVCIAILPK